MDSPTRAVTPLRQRMLDDMRLRKLGDKTQSAYIRAVRQLAGFLGRAPDTATVEDLRPSCTWSITAPRRSRSTPPSPG
jgi:hypothetical protein